MQSNKDCIPFCENIEVGELFADNSSRSIPEEAHDVANLGRIGHLSVYLYAGVEYGSLTVEEQSISVGNVFKYLFVYSARPAYR